MPSNMVTVRLKREEAERVDDAIEAALSEDTVETPAPFALKAARDTLRSALAAKDGDPHSVEQFAAAVATDNVRLRCGIQKEIKRLQREINEAIEPEAHRLLDEAADHLSALLDEEAD